MPWLAGMSLSVLQRFCLNILKCGPIPRHVAFIIDGNRRYGKQRKISASQTHYQGFEKVVEALHWCLALGVTDMTLYVLSIENLKRSAKELDFLIGLLEQQFQQIVAEREAFAERGVCVKFIGDLSLLPRRLRKTLAQVVAATQDNSSFFLTFALAYTAKDEMANTMRTIAHGVQRGDLRVEDIDEDLFSRCLYTRTPDANLLIRTSGEVRLSDFLLWQSHASKICFLEVLWPEFSLVFSFLACIFMYQRDQHHLKLYQFLTKGRAEATEEKQRDGRIARFLQMMHKRRLERLQAL